MVQDKGKTVCLFNKKKMNITKFSQLKSLINDFDFSTLDFYNGSNPIFWNSNISSFEAWVVGTNIEQAEQENNVLYVGSLTEKEAHQGSKPKPNEERIKMHYTRELV